jgi:hypothetical protein
MLKAAEKFLNNKGHYNFITSLTIVRLGFGTDGNATSTSQDSTLDTLDIDVLMNLVFRIL